MPVRLALLDDDDRFRAQLCRRLGYFPNVEVVTEAATIDDFFTRLAGPGPLPDVALLDVELRGESGITAAERLSREYPSIGVLILTVFEDPDKIFRSVQAGASGYFLKDAEADAIVDAAEEMRRGGAPLSRTVARKILDLVRALPAPDAPDPRTSQGPSDGGADPPLSPREVELLEYIVRGETEAQIARRLFISPHTVRTHVKSIYRKLHVRSRAAAVRLTLESGLLHRPPSKPP